MRIYKTATDIYRGDTAQYDLSNYDPDYGGKVLGKDNGSSMAYGPGIYFVGAKDIAEMYGEFITQRKLNSGKIISEEGSKFSYGAMKKIILSVPKDRLQVAVSNWAEDYRNGLEQLINSVAGNDNPVEQILSIWGEVYHHQHGREFMELMVKNGIDGISKNRHETTYYVIYNLSVLS